MYVAREGFRDDVVATGSVNEAEKIAFLRNGFVHVLSFLYEGFGLPALEAQICGRPCPHVPPGWAASALRASERPRAAAGALHERHDGGPGAGESTRRSGERAKRTGGGAARRPVRWMAGRDRIDPNRAAAHAAPRSPGRGTAPSGQGAGTSVSGAKSA